MKDNTNASDQSHCKHAHEGHHTHNSVEGSSQRAQDYISLRREGIRWQRQAEQAQDELNQFLGSVFYRFHRLFSAPGDSGRHPSDRDTNRQRPGTAEPDTDMQRKRQVTLRETAYWQRVAQQTQNELGQYYASFSYRLYRLIWFILSHRSTFIPLALIGVACLILSPLLLFIALFPAGRNALARLARRSAALDKLLTLVRQHSSVAENLTRGVAREKKPLILKRSTGQAAHTVDGNASQHRAQCLGQLGPQTRYRLQRLGLNCDAGHSAINSSAVKSLDRSEISIARIALADAAGAKRAG